MIETGNKKIEARFKEVINIFNYHEEGDFLRKY